MQRPHRPIGAHDLLKQQVTRVERVVAFAAAVARPLREEFDLFWRPESPRLAGDRQVAFKAQVEALLARLAAGEALLEQYRAMSPQEALAALSRYDSNGMIAEASAMESQARRLREEPAIQSALIAAAAPRPRPTPAASARTETDRVLKLLKNLVKPAGTRPLAGARTSPLAAQWELEMGRFEAAFNLVARVLGYCEPRLSLLRMALEAAGIPGPVRPWKQVEASLPGLLESEAVPKAQSAWLISLTRLVYSNPEAARKAHIAVVQWQGAKALMEEAELLKRAMSSLPAEKQLQLLAQFNVGKFRAAIFPLSNLHVSLKGTLLLQDLFPPPPAPEKKV